jgi:hypothetical protein
MGRKNAATSAVAATDPVNNPRILVPMEKPGDPVARPQVSRDPLYETDRYRLVTPIASEPGRIDGPLLSPASE